MEESRMNLIQAAACLVLWQSHRFDTLDIAEALGLPEPSVVIMLDAIRDAERGPQFHVIEGSLA
jgi:hypothetical protein